MLEAKKDESAGINPPKQTRTARLKSYLNAKYYHGPIRWMLVGENNCSVYCDRCGNIVNAVMQTRRSLGVYSIPLCRKHFADTFPEATQVPDVRQYVKPSKKPKPVLAVGSKVKWCHYADMPKMRGQIVSFLPNGLVRVSAGNGFAEIPVGMVEIE